MYYVELLRARRTLTWYCSVVLACVGLALALALKDGRSHVQVSPHGLVPLDSLLVGSGFGAIFLAAFMAVGLDAEFKTAAIAWTRPIQRLRIAASFIAIDVATLVVAWLFTTAVALGVTLVLGVAQYIRFSDAAQTPVWLALIFGCSLMWYGLVLLVTMLVPGRGNAMVGASWAYVLFVPALASIPFPPLLHRVMVALNYINPLAYVSSSGPDRGGIHVQSDGGPIFGGSAGSHVLVTWAIAIVAVAVAARIWTQREVPA